MAVCGALCFAGSGAGSRAQAPKITMEIRIAGVRWHQKIIRLLKVIAGSCRSVMSGSSRSSGNAQNSGVHAPHNF